MSDARSRSVSKQLQNRVMDAPKDSQSQQKQSDSGSKGSRRSSSERRRLVRQRIADGQDAVTS